MQVVAKALIYNAAGQILVLRRSDSHPHFPLHDDLPGGAIERNETPLAGLIREVREEAGLHTDQEDYNLVHEWNPRSDCHDLLYEVSLTAPQSTISISWEHDRFSWKSVEDVLNEPQPAMIDDFYAGALEYLQTTTSQ